MSSNPHFICRENMEKKEKLHVEGRDLYLVSKSYQVNLNIWKETITMFTTMLISWKLHDLSIWRTVNKDSSCMILMHQFFCCLLVSNTKLMFFHNLI